MLSKTHVISKKTCFFVNIRMLSPFVSIPALPARPTICLYRDRHKNSLPMYGDLIMTLQKCRVVKMVGNALTHPSLSTIVKVASRNFSRVCLCHKGGCNWILVMLNFIWRKHTFSDKNIATMICTSYMRWTFNPWVTSRRIKLCLWSRNGHLEYQDHNMHQNFWRSIKGLS